MEDNIDDIMVTPTGKTNHKQIRLEEWLFQEVKHIYFRFRIIPS